MSASRWARFVAMGVLLAPSAHPKEVTCQGLTVPYTVDFEVDNTPASGGQVQLTITVTPEVAIDRLRLVFTTDGVVTLQDPLDRELIGLVAGNAVQFNGVLDITGPGGGGLYAGSTIYDDTVCGEELLTGEEFAFFVLDDGASVRTGGGSALELQMRRLQDLIDAGGLSNEEAMEEYDLLVRAEGTPGEGAGSPSPDPEAGGNVTISGTARWTDSAGGVHPCRDVEVKAYIDGLVFGLNEVAATTTNASGAFSFSLDPADLGSAPRDITVRIFSKNSAANVRTDTTIVVFGGNTYFQERRYADVSDGDSFTGETYTANNMTVQDRSFSVADAMIEGRGYIQTVNASSMGQINVNYPRSGSGTASFYTGFPQRIEVHRSKPFMWDVLLHEYGHYVADEFDLDDSPGGNHNCGDNLIDRYNKSTGVRLAWGEGLATYLGTAAQIVQGTSALSVPLAGDTSYHSVGATSGVAWQYDNEARDSCTALSEGSETNVSRCLWDVADAAADGDDAIALGHPAVWTAIKGISGPESLSDAWNAFIAGKTTEQKTQYGAVFEQNRVSPGLAAPPDGDGITTMPPTFKWRKNSLNEFEVKLYDESWNEIGASGALGDVEEWTPSQSEWDTVLAAGSGSVQWVVEGQNTDSPSTGTYWSGSRKLKPVDFAFVIDDTGSMSEEIAGVRQALLNFIAGFDPTATDVWFQLTTFKDGVSVRPPTNDVSAIQSQVSALFASGGGDCPEQSGGGLSQGTVNIRRGGTVLFATDADPRPGTDLPGLISQLRSRGARVNVLLSGSCTPVGALVPASRAAQQSAHANQPTWDDSVQGGGGTPFGTGFSNAVDAFSQIATATGGAFAFVPEVNSGGSGAVEYANAAENILQASIGPRVVVAAPSVLPQGATASVVLTGQNTSFLASSVPSFSDGIVVQGVAAIDPVTLQVNLRVEPTATLGFKDVVVDTALGGGATENALGLGVIEIVAPAAFPVLVAASPAVVTRGQDTVVRISAENTAFDATTTVAIGSGVTVNSVTTIDPTTLDVDISVPIGASAGFPSVVATTGASTASPTELDFLRIQALPPSIPIVQAVTPGQGTVGDVLQLQIEVTDLSLDPTGTSVEVTGSGVTVTSVVACESTVVADVTIARDAPPGPRDVIVRSGGDSAIAINAFVVAGVTGLPCFSIREFWSNGEWEFLTIRGTFDVGDGFDPTTEGLTIEVEDGDGTLATYQLDPGHFDEVDPSSGWYLYAETLADGTHLSFAMEFSLCEFELTVGGDVDVEDLDGPDVTVRIRNAAIGVSEETFPVFADPPCLYYFPMPWPTCCDDC